jgi:hypothetical protein
MERAVKALESMAEDPIVEMEIGPPVCPHCSKFNPQVKTDAHEGVGPLFEYAVAFICLECEQPFYGVPVQWSLHQEVTTLRIELEGRKGSGNGNQP